VGDAVAALRQQGFNSREHIVVINKRAVGAEKSADEVVDFAIARNERVVPATA
jgi:hypothetical protein